MTTRQDALKQLEQPDWGAWALTEPTGNASVDAFLEEQAVQVARRVWRGIIEDGHFRLNVDGEGVKITLYLDDGMIEQKIDADDLLIHDTDEPSHIEAVGKLLSDMLLKTVRVQDEMHREQEKRNAGGTR